MKWRTPRTIRQVVVAKTSSTWKQPVWVPDGLLHVAVFNVETFFGFHMPREGEVFQGWRVVQRISPFSVVFTGEERKTAEECGLMFQVSAAYNLEQEIGEVK